MVIDKFITPFIQAQFPSVYEDEGALFVAFAKAYYQWMESQGQVLNNSRSLPEYRDIDTTLVQFVNFFKHKYIDDIPETVLADKKLLVKHILDLYRAKGTDASYKLLFRMLFNEDIDIFIPSKNIFKLSDGLWTVPKYIEVSDHPLLQKLVGKVIYSSSSKATAVVDQYFTKPVNSKLINVLSLNNIKGHFKYGEKVLCESIPELIVDDAPIIFGSLTSVSIKNGGLGYKIGDEIDVIGSGVGGIAVVASTRDKNGEVEFNLLSGGTGFSMTPDINIEGAAFSITNVTNTNPVVVSYIPNPPTTLANKNTVRIDYVQGRTSVNIPGYTYYVNVINSTAFSLYNDINLSNTVNGTSWGSPYQANSGFIFLNTGGAGAYFQIGSLVNKEIYQLNTDFISDYYNTIIDDKVAGWNISVANVAGVFTANNTVYTSNVNTIEADVLILTQTIPTRNETLSNTALGISNVQICITDGSFLKIRGSDITNANLTINTVLVSNATNTSFQIRHLGPVLTSNCTANVVFVNSSVISVDWQSDYMYPGTKIYDANTGANAVITTVTRDTNWGFPSVHVPDIDNMDTPIGVALTIINKEVGTIASLTNINPGSGYTLNPIVLVVEPLIYDLQIVEPDGSIKGFNAVIDGTAENATGIISSIVIEDSGFGYDRDQDVYLRSSTNPYSVNGTTVVNIEGKSKGYWQDARSFASDVMKLQDSYYYQTYSYEIIAARMLSTYETYVKNLIHPAGMLLFGRFVNQQEMTNTPSTLADSSFTYTA